MPKDKDIVSAIDGLEKDITGLVNNFVSSRKKTYTQAALKYKDLIKNDLAKFGDLLAEGKLTEDEFGQLAKFRAAQAKIEVLAEVSISKSKFGDLTDAIFDKAIRATVDIAVTALR